MREHWDNTHGTWTAFPYNPVNADITIKGLLSPSGVLQGILVLFSSYQCEGPHNRETELQYRTERPSAYEQ